MIQMILYNRNILYGQGILILVVKGIILSLQPASKMQAWSNVQRNILITIKDPPTPKSHSHPVIFSASPAYSSIR